MNDKGGGADPAGESDPHGRRVYKARLTYFDTAYAYEGSEEATCPPTKSTAALVKGLYLFISLYIIGA